MSRYNGKPVFLTGFLALTALAAFVLSRASVAQNAAATVEAPQKWEYTIVRLEGPTKNADASIAVLNRYGTEGWEAVELLPPAYDILMKRPVH